jgi:diacylglycerol kinase family enzyme
MRARLLVNPNAGYGDPGEALVLAAFRELGWTIDPIADEALVTHTPEVLVIVGGDGTLARVVRRYHRWPTRVVVLPGGTANNVARTLGARSNDVLQEIRRLARTREIAGDVGVVHGSCDLFLESFGIGAFASLLRLPDISENKGVPRARSLLAETLEVQPAARTKLVLDGRRIEGAYLVVEVMNTKSFGPAFELAPEARIDDELFDVCLVPESARAELAQALRAPVGTPLPGVERHRARRIQIETTEPWAHVDGTLRDVGGKAELAVVPGEVRYLVPAHDGD